MDFGTQGVRVGVFDDKGGVVAIHEQKYATHHPKPGYAEQQPSDWITCMEQATGGCYDKAGADAFSRVAGLTVCTTSSTVIPIDSNNQPLSSAILWMDNRAVTQAAKINKTRHKVLKYCGKEVSVEWIVPKMMWLRDNEPQIFEQAARIVEFQDFINHHLTGRWCASVSQATCKSNYVEAMGGFNKEFFSAIGFEEFFDKANLDVVKQAQPVGTLRAEIAEKLRLPEDISVYQGSIDAHVNVVGLGVCCAGETGVVMGSSFAQLALMERIAFEDGIWGPYKDGVIPGLYCLEGGQVSAGSITKWFIRNFNVEGENPYMVMAEEAQNIPAGSEGVMMLDFFQGNRTPYKDPLAKGVFYGLTLSHTRAHMYRALLEGVAFGTRNILDRMENDRDAITRLRSCGGVTFNRIWLQIIADVTGKPIMLTAQSGNAGILGCSIIAAVGCGHFDSFKQACDSMVHVTEIIQPNKQRHKQYNKIYREYLELYRNLKAMMHQ